MKIGLFDSGLGGLTILRAVARELPQHDYFYYGDTVNLPYGDKTEAEIYQFSVAAMNYLFNHGCTLVITACNTASAETLRKLQDKYLPAQHPDHRILGVIVPTVETLVDTGAEHVLLLATKRTVESKKYERELGSRTHSIVLTAIATPELVPLIETGKLEEAAAAAAERVSVAMTNMPALDTVVLGCTHYTELKTELRVRFGAQLRILSQDEIIPAKLASYIAAHPELNRGEVTTGARSIHLTQHRSEYDRITAQLLGGAMIYE